jgi:hypothetical protein
MAKKLIELEKECEMFVLELQKKDISKGDKKRSLSKIINDVLRSIAQNEK